MVGDRQVLVLWPPILGSRSWGGAFFSPHLEAAPAGISEAVELSAERAEEWCMRLGLAVAAE